MEDLFGGNTCEACGARGHHAGDPVCLDTRIAMRARTTDPLASHLHAAELTANQAALKGRARHYFNDIWTHPGTTEKDSLERTAEFFPDRTHHSPITARLVERGLVRKGRWMVRRGSRWVHTVYAVQHSDEDPPEPGARLVVDVAGGR